jgi:Heparinase II/III-like protein/Heparinase II/III N-terminus
MNAASLVRRTAAMDRRELRFRIQCETRKILGRARHLVLRPRWKRSALTRLLDPAYAPGVADACLALKGRDYLAAHRALGRHFLARRSAWPLSASAREDLARTVRERFPSAVGDARRRAEGLAAGRHDLLGYRDVECGTPPDWHRDPIHGIRAPLKFWTAVPYLDPSCGDHKIIWELNRHQHWRALGRAFWLTGDRRYRDVFVSELESWMQANPPERGVNWASMLEPAFRTMSWAWAVEFFSADAASDETPWLVDLLVALDRQLAHVEHNLSYYFSPNTHLSGEALALYVVSQAFPELRASRARASLGRDILLHEADRQVRADGGHVELSPHYHRYSTDFYLLALLVARQSRDTAASRFEAAARAQARYLRTITDDDGRLPLIGDDDGGQLFGMCGGRSSDAAETLATAAAVLKDATLAVGPAPEETYWALGRAPAMSVGVDHVTKWPSQALGASGYFVSRTGRGDHLVFDAGPHGYLNGGHAHSDALSLVLTLDRHPLLIDPGTATYTMNAGARDAFRSTRMHNTVTLNGHDHSAPHGPFHWHTRANGRMLAAYAGAGFDFAQGTHDAYGTLRHVRSVLALHGLGWIVVDAIDGHAYAAADSWWHLHPRWTASKQSNGVDLTDADGRSLTIAFTTRDLEVQTGTPLAQYSPEYGRIEPSVTIRASAQRTAPFVIGTFVPASARGASAHEHTTTIAEIAVRSQPASGWTGNAFAIRAGSSDVLVLVATPSVDTATWQHRRWGTSTVQTDARVLAVYREAHRWKTIAIVGGRIVAARAEVGLPGEAGESSALPRRTAVEAAKPEGAESSLEVSSPQLEVGS